MQFNKDTHTHTAPVRRCGTEEKQDTRDGRKEMVTVKGTGTGTGMRARMRMGTRIGMGRYGSGNENKNREEG